MKREDLDVMWSIATKKSIEDNEPFTRYEFAKLVAAKEREACAKVCEDREWGNKETYAAQECANAIRARGNP